MTRILIVSPFVPYPPDRGHRVRIFWLMRQLALHYRVGLVTQCYFPGDWDAVASLREKFPDLDPVVAVKSPAHRSICHRGWYAAASRLAALAGSPRELMYHSTRVLRDAVEGIARAWRPHLVQGEYWFSRRAIPAVPGARVWIDSIDLHWLRAQRASLSAAGGWSLGHRRHAHVIGRHECAAYESVDRVLTVHDVETGVLRERLSTTRVSTVPIACEVPATPAPRVAGSVVLFIGALDYVPNRDAVRFLARDVMPTVRAAAPGSRLRVVGHLPRARGLPSEEWIQYTGFVPDLPGVLSEVGAGVAPLRLGSGTSVKVLSMLGLGLPMVASSRAVEGLPLTAGTHYLLAEDAKDMASALATLLTDATKSHALGICGHRVALEEFEWRRTADRVAALYGEVLTG